MIVWIWTTYCGDGFHDCWSSAVEVKEEQIEWRENVKFMEGFVTVFFS